MNESDNKEILLELRRIRSVAQGMFWLLVLMILLSVSGSLISRYPRSTPSANAWTSVENAMNYQYYPKALAEARALVEGQPNNWYGQSYLGNIYLAMGDTTNAHKHYLRAYQLFPNEENEKALAAIRSRISEPPPLKLLSR